MKSTFQKLKNSTVLDSSIIGLSIILGSLNLQQSWILFLPFSLLALHNLCNIELAEWEKSELKFDEEVFDRKS